MNMSILEIIGGILLILTCVLAVILCLLQDSKQQQNMTAAITGGANDSFYEKNEGRTKEAFFRKITRVLLIALFVLSLSVRGLKCSFHYCILFYVIILTNSGCKNRYFFQINKR